VDGLELFSVWMGWDCSACGWVGTVQRVDGFELFSVWMGWNCSACGWVGTVQRVDGLELFNEQFQHNHTSGRQQESITIPKAAHTVL
jgi:hypothetical protein